MEPIVGQSILVDGVKADVLGMIRFSSYSEYLIRLGGKKLWLEVGRDWRLWRKAKFPALEAYRVENFFKFGAYRNFLSALGDEKDFNGFVAREMGFALVCGTMGETEDINIRDKVTYLEMNSPESDLVCVELWEGEEKPEFYKGKIVKVTSA